MSTKLPPFSDESEKAVLGSLFICKDNSLRSDVFQMLTPDHFFLQRHQIMYRVMDSVFSRTDDVDWVLVSDEIKRQGKTLEVGGNDYIIQTAESTPSAVNMKHYAEIVRDKYLLRKTMSLCAKFGDMAGSNGTEANELLGELQAQMDSVSSEAGVVDDKDCVSDHIFELADEIKNRKRGKCNGLATGFCDIDNLTQGFSGGEMIVIAARPSHGKTSLSMNIAENVAFWGTPVAIFSLEMSRKNLMERMLVARAGIDSQLAKAGGLSADDNANIDHAAQSISDTVILISEASSVTPNAIAYKCKQYVQKYNIGLVIIDYLQLVRYPGITSKVQEVTEVSRCIKLLAMEIDLPIIVMSQLNRSIESRDDKTPRLSDLRESGAIEQDADTCIFLHREDQDNIGRQDYVQTNICDVVIAKQRNGPTGKIKLVWDGNRTQFKNKAHDDIF
jgi:replicative DNA helicase